MRTLVALALLLTLVAAGSVLGGPGLRSARYEMPWLVTTGGAGRMDSPNFRMESRVMIQPVESARSPNFRLHGVPRPEGGGFRPVLVVRAGRSAAGVNVMRTPDLSFELLDARY